MSEILSELHQVLESRKGADPDSSYVASLYAKGLNKILEKEGEECTETLLAAKDAEHFGETRDVVYETADLWFHSMVMDDVQDFLISDDMDCEVWNMELQLCTTSWQH